MFGSFPQSELTIVSPDGTVRGVEKGIIDSKLATISNKNAVILAGDEIRRKLPNGIEETFEVVDPVFYNGMGGAIPAHYQVKIRRKGSFLAGTGGNFTFNVSGPNARVNIGSHDNSQNFASGNNIFVELKDKILSALPDSEERIRLLALIETGSRLSSSKRRGAGTASPSAFISAKCAASASAALATASSNVSPAAMQPGTSGKLTP